jgi:hypothetical protein
MGDSGQAQGARGAGASLLGSVIAGGGACAMGAAAASLRSEARGAHGQEQLIGWVLLGLAAAGALLCLYLALVWALAATIQLAGPAGRLGRTLLPALRVLAPRLARRVSMGAAVATAATGLVLGPVLASEPVPGGAEERPTVLQTSQLLPDGDPAPTAGSEDEPEEPLPSLGWGGGPVQGTADPEADDAEETTVEEDGAPESDAEKSSSDEADSSGARDGEDPSGEDRADGSGEDVTGGQDAEAEPGTDPDDTADDAAEDAAPEDGTTAQDSPAENSPAEDSPRGAQAETDTEAPPGDAPEESDASDRGGADRGEADQNAAEDTGHDDQADTTRRTVVVQQGDSLWSITDDVLGPAPEDAALLASSWPLLHEANRDVIGDDPDLLRPGQVLTVPAALAEGATS